MHFVVFHLLFLQLLWVFTMFPLVVLPVSYFKSYASTVTRMLLNLANINHLNTALSNSSYFPALTLILSKLIVPDENAVITFFLFASKSHVEIVFLGTPYTSANNDIDCPFSISFNALNLSSMVVLYFYCDFSIFSSLF